MKKNKHTRIKKKKFNNSFVKYKALELEKDLGAQLNGTKNKVFMPKHYAIENLYHFVVVGSCFCRRKIISEHNCKAVKRENLNEMKES